MKVFVAIPVYANVPSQFLGSMNALLKHAPWPFDIQMIQHESLITRARNRLTAAFLQSDCTHLLFIDADIIFSREDLEMIGGHDVDIVAGLYALKREGNITWCANAGTPTAPREDGLQEVAYAGTGFMLIKRIVFEKMMLADGKDFYYQTDDKPAQVHFDFWRVGVYNNFDGRRRYFSEDFFFCKRWSDLGGKIYVDSRIVLDHIGVIAFPTLAQRNALEEQANRAAQLPITPSAAPELAVVEP